MNYYKHHIGDYARDTAHLSMLEDAAYRRMLDLYYASEKPLPALDALCRLIRARSKEERRVVEQILLEFFEQREDGWHQRRCDSELAAMQAKAGTNRDNGKKGGRPKKEPTDNPQKTQSVSEANPNETLATTHKPLPISQERAETPPAARASRLDLTELPPGWKAFCQAERPDLDPERTFAKFCDYWKAVPGRKGGKLDWEATWRNWVRDERKANGSADSGKFNPHAYGRKLLAEALAAEGMDRGTASQAVPGVPGQLLAVVPRSGND